MSQAHTLTWLAGHELKLAWRDWLWLMTAGHRHRLRNVVIAFIVFAIFMHLLAWSMVGPYAVGITTDKATLVIVSGTLLLSWSLLLSQAMESVTRAFYSRSDLDLILTSPIDPRKVFSVRIGRIALAVALLAMLLALPFIDVLTFLGGAHWLAAYGVVAAMGAVVAALAVALTVALFRLIGPRRTRLIAQIVAAVIGAAFVIGLQIAAIVSYGSLSRNAVLQSQWLLTHAPDLDSVLWWPARALLGDPQALASVVGVSLVLLGAAILIFSPRFGDHVLAAAGVSQASVRQRETSAFCGRSAARALRHKEWTLLKRDPWLMSQTLMQILYLLPPAVMLWRSFEGGSSAIIVLVPVLVMAAGQLGGGLAWLSISGEDAPDLVATAPVSPRRIIAAKIEAVMGAIGIIFAPLLLALAFVSTQAAVTAVFGVFIAAGAATLIQLCFRTQAKRSLFRRRQVSSRIATFAEAFSSISWAAAAALAAAGSWFAAFPIAVALAILGGVRLIAPKQP